MTQKDHISFIEEHNGVFYIHDLARHLGWPDGGGFHKKAMKMNGEFGYDADARTFTTGQAVTLLRELFREGSRRPIKDPVKQERSKGFCEAAGMPINVDMPEVEEAVPSPAKPRTVTKERTPTLGTPTKPQRPRPAKRARSKTYALVEEPKEENQLKGSFLTDNRFIMTLVIVSIFVQASHFTMYYIRMIQEESDLMGWVTVIYGVLIGLIVESLAFVLVANGKGREWLQTIAVISFSINCLYNKTYEERGWDLFGEIILNALIPLCIYLFSELYFEKDGK